jgi:hypothetical protein
MMSAARVSVSENRWLAARAAAGDVLGDDDGPWLSDIIIRLLAEAPNGTTFERLSDFDWRKAASRRRRDAWNGLADLLAHGCSKKEKIVAVRRERKIYERQKWTRDQDRTVSPYPNPRTSEHWLFIIFRAGVEIKGDSRAKLVPDSPKNLRRIIA